MMLVGRGDKLRCVFDDVSWWGDYYSGLLTESLITEPAV